VHGTTTALLRPNYRSLLGEGSHLHPVSRWGCALAGWFNCLDTLQASQDGDSKRHRSIPIPSLLSQACHKRIRHQKRFCVAACRGRACATSLVAFPSLNDAAGVLLCEVGEDTNLFAEQLADGFDQWRTGSEALASGQCSNHADLLLGCVA
jgi:hypothetical protein